MRSLSVWVVIGLMGLSILLAPTMHIMNDKIRDDTIENGSEIGNDALSENVEEEESSTVDRKIEKNQIDQSTNYEGETVKTEFEFKKHFPGDYDTINQIDQDDTFFNWEDADEQKQWIVDDIDDDELSGISGEIQLSGYTSGTLYYNLTVQATKDTSGIDTVNVGGTVSDPYTDASGIIRVWFIAFTEKSGSNNYLDMYFALFNGENWGNIDSDSTFDAVDGWERLTITWHYLYYQQNSIVSNIRSQYRYVNEKTKERSLFIENPEYLTNITVKAPVGWNLARINPVATYEKVGHNYIFYGNTIPVTYEVIFLEKLNNILAIEDISYRYLNDIDLETGIDWQENNTETFDSLTLSNEIFAYGSTSYKLEDTDTSIDTLNITNALPIGIAFASFKYYIQSLGGNFTFLYFNGSWQSFNLDNTSSRWVLFQDEINITSNSFSNVAFQLQGNGTVYIDGFRVYNATTEAITYSYDYTMIDGFLRNWDSQRDPLLTYENITIYLKNNTDTLEVGNTETDGEGYFSILSTYSFTANQYHIEVTTSTTSLTQNSSTTYLKTVNHPFPVDFVEALLHSKMDEGSGNNVSDCTGNGHHGTNNGATWVSGLINGSALDFESGDTDYVDYTDKDDFSFTDGAGNDKNFTIELWVKPESLSSSARLISKYGNSTNGEYLVTLTTDGRISFWLMDTATTDRIGISTLVGSALEVGKTTYYVITYNGNETWEGFTVYLNGSIVSSTDVSLGSYSGCKNLGGVLSIGAQREIGATYLPFDGIIDDFRIYFDKVLNSSVIAQRYSDYLNYSTYGDSHSWYEYSSSSITKSVQQKSYFTPLNISATVPYITLYQSVSHFLIDSSNSSLVFRTWSDDTFSGDFFVNEWIPKNTSIGQHNFTFIAFMAAKDVVYLKLGYYYLYEIEDEQFSPLLTYTSRYLKQGSPFQSSISGNFFDKKWFILNATRYDYAESISTTGWAQGSHYLNFFANSTWGQEWNESIEIIIDDTSPVFYNISVSGINLVNGTWLKNKLTRFDVNATDNQFVAYVGYKWDNDTLWTNSSTLYFSHDLSLLEWGNRTFYLRVYDKAGNYNETVFILRVGDYTDILFEIYDADQNRLFDLGEKGFNVLIDGYEVTTEFIGNHTISIYLYDFLLTEFDTTIYQNSPILVYLDIDLKTLKVISGNNPVSGASIYVKSYNYTFYCDASGSVQVYLPLNETFRFYIEGAGLTDSFSRYISTTKDVYTFELVSQPTNFLLEFLKDPTGFLIKFLANPPDLLDAFLNLFSILSVLTTVLGLITGSYLFYRFFIKKKGVRI